MATYSSFKRVISDAIVDSTIVADDIAPNTIPAEDIADGNVTGPKMSGVVTSAKIANTINISGKTVTYRAITDSDISASAAISGAKLASGAATGNLGYTPVNRAGDTMTGTLVVPAGSNSAPSIAFSSSSNTGINLTSGNVAFVVSGQTAININSSGFITRPNHPAFAAVGQNGWLYGANHGLGGSGEVETGSVQNWTTAHQYGGPNFANATGRFTAPVTGYYAFHTWWYLLNDPNTTNGYIHCFFRKNNNRAWTQGGRSPYTINLHRNAYNYDDGQSYAAVMDMNAGDYCSLAVVFHNANIGRYHSGHQVFSGYLIG